MALEGDGPLAHAPLGVLPVDEPALLETFEEPALAGRWFETAHPLLVVPIQVVFVGLYIR